MLLYRVESIRDRYYIMPRQHFRTIYPLKIRDRAEAKNKYINVWSSW